MVLPVVHGNLACDVNSLFARYKSRRLGKFSILTETVEEKHFPLSQRGDSIYKPPMDLDYDGVIKQKVCMRVVSIQQ